KGDLLLVAGTTIPSSAPHAFRTRSSALCRASPIWAKMLAPGSAGSVLGGFRTDGVLELPGDRPDALRVLLSAAHGKFRWKPVRRMWAKWDFGLVVEVLTLAEKYQALGALAPWVRAWSGMLRSAIGECCWMGMVEGAVKKMEVAWLLGDSGGLVEAVRGVALTGYEGDIATLLKIGEAGFEMGLPPAFSEIFEKAVGYRIDLIQEILDEFHTHVDGLANDDEGNTCVHSRRPLEERRICRSTISLEVQRSLAQFQVPRTASDIQDSSVADLARRLLSSLCVGAKCLPRHRQCSPSVHFSLQCDVLVDGPWRWDSLLSEEHLQFLLGRQQAFQEERV
ncbi:hypothetical protein C8A05DRAFT_37656, partial [Staphylotrichum tortipilum]